MRFLTAFGLTVFAGLATGIGGALAFFTKKTNTKFLAISLGFSAGVMIYVSMVEIFQKAKNALTSALGNFNGYWAVLGGFFGGILLIAIIDKLIPKAENPHELKKIEDMDVSKPQINNKRLLRMGLFTALAVTIHNFPEGIATFMTAINSLEVAIPITVAIAIHNIPEGIAVAVPIYHATGSRKKAFWLSFSSGLAEPVGAIIAYLFLIRFWNPVLDALILAIIAGVMIYISLDELLPSAEKYGKHHLSIIGLVTGMVIMAVSLYLFI